MSKPAVSLKARALRYLSMREHSRQELARKLQRYAQEGDDIEALLDWLERSKFLSQGRFVEALVHRRAARFGNRRILQELQSHGIQNAALGDVKVALQSDEALRACEVWAGKFGERATDAAGRARQMRFLMQRGFSQTAIRVALEGSRMSTDTGDDGELLRDEHIDGDSEVD